MIASGFPERTDPNALVIGPTGVAFDDDTGILYVADSAEKSDHGHSCCAFSMTQRALAIRCPKEEHSMIHSVLRLRRITASLPRTETTATWSK